MIIQIDTRQQKGKHILTDKVFEELGVDVRHFGMLVGDYQIFGKGDIVVDTKKDIVELASNLFQQHDRFKRECLTAQSGGVKLIVLIEEDFASIEDMAGRWTSPLKKNGEPYTYANSKILAKVMQTMQDKYGVEFKFCDKEETGKKILEILKNDKFGDKEILAKYKLAEEETLVKEKFEEDKIFNRGETKYEQSNINW